MVFKIALHLINQLKIFASDKKPAGCLTVESELLTCTKLLTLFPSGICCITFRWNNNEQRFVSFNEKKHGNKLKWTCFHFLLMMISVYLVGEIGQLLSGFTEDRKLIQTLMEMMAIIAMSGCTFGRFMYSRNALSFTNCFNNSIKYLYKSKDGIHPKFAGLKYNLLLSVLLGMTANQILIPLVVSIAAVYFPCLSSVLGYKLLPECMTNNHIGSFGKVDILIRTTVVVSYILTCALTCAGGLVEISVGLTENAFLLSECLLSYKMKVLNRIQKMSTPSHYSNVGLQNDVSEYRQIQLLTTLYNEVNQNYLIVGYAVMIISFQVLSLYVCISLSDKIPGLFTLLFFVCAVNLVPLTVCIFSYVADIFGSSVKSKHAISHAFSDKVVSSLNPSFSCINHRWYSRFLRSCRLVRSELGRFYFIDSCIPLEFESFAIE